MAKAGSQIYTIDVFCQECDTQLYRYKKEGKGHLVKCYLEGILKDFTDTPMECPGCNTHFAREAMYHGKPAYKIIQGKVYVRR